MKETKSTININHTAIAQAGQLVSLATCREQKISETPFSDNLDYLQALEQEGKLILVQALLRQRGADWQSNPNYVRAISIAGLTPPEAKPEKLAELIALIEQQHRIRAAAAEKNGVTILFTKFCREKKLEGFNRTVILLLLLLATSERFIEIFDLCNFGDAARRGNEVKIGTILDIICRDYEEQLASRQCFSVDSSLMQQDILHIERSYDETSNILEKKVCLYERYVRYIIGDNHLYKSATSIIQRDTSSVSLGQVIVPNKTKDELVSHIGNYLAYRDSNKSKDLDDFYGYGTALTMLFYGPSGTGKTMMAQALSCHFNRPLYSLKSSEFRRRDIYIPAEDIIKNLFLEASLNSGIVFFDEADDIFEKDSYLSHLLLIQIEKARCVVILSTNKPVDLDPAMDRRLSLKVHFQIPEIELRYKMWQSLMPDFVNLAPDVNLKFLAERYQFTGGLIKNSIFMAIISSLMSKHNENSVVTMEMIERAAELQLRQMVDMSKLYRIYSPLCKISDLQINLEQRNELGNVAKAYQNLQEKKLGLNILVTCADVQTGINAVEALAHECSLKIKNFDYMNLYQKNSRDDKVFDPITQNKMYPMDFAFAENTGDASLMMFVDYVGVINWTRNVKKDEDEDKRILPHIELLRHLRDYQGLFCMVTVEPLKGILPAEFNAHFHMEYPPEETQMQQWEKHLVKNKISDDELVSLVENNPMHVAEIDFIAKQAIIQSTIKARSDGLSIKDVESVIARYRPKRATPLLFGRSKC